jgi:hypothetical protein
MAGWNSRFRSTGPWYSCRSGGTATVCRGTHAGPVARHSESCLLAAGPRGAGGGAPGPRPRQVCAGDPQPGRAHDDKQGHGPPARGLRGSSACTSLRPGTAASRSGRPGYEQAVPAPAVEIWRLRGRSSPLVPARARHLHRPWIQAQSTSRYRASARNRPAEVSASMTEWALACPDASRKSLSTDGRRAVSTSVSLRRGPSSR